MTKKNWIMITLIAVLLAAGVAADIFFWKHIATATQAQQDRQQTQMAAISAQIAEQQMNLLALQNKLSQFMRSEQQSNAQQTLNEIAYLLDLANLYLQINHDTVNAIKSLQLAQRRVQMLADSSLLPLQQALASDLNRLNDLPQIDTAEVLLSLQTLTESISRLTLVPQQLPPSLNTAEIPAKSASPWYQQSLRALWNSFKNLLVIHYDNSERSPVLPLNQREWVKENIAFTLAQAQWAVLQQKSALYQHSLTQVRQWTMDNYPDNSARQKILTRLAQLAAIDIAPAVPDIHASLQAVRQALQQTPAALPTPPPSPPPAPVNIPTAPPSTGIEI